MKPGQFAAALLMFAATPFALHRVAAGDGKLPFMDQARAAPAGNHPDQPRTSQTLAIEHVRLACRRSFDDVHAALLKSLPQLDPKLRNLLENGNSEEIAAERATGPKLWLFLTRDHGALLRAEGRRAKAYQYEIGNPLTAERMTRHKLPAGLYAPLRVFLYEDSNGHAFFEYDRPSSLFGQFGDDEVTKVGRELDDELEHLLLAASS